MTSGLPRTRLLNGHPKICWSQEAKPGPVKDGALERLLPRRVLEISIQLLVGRPMDTVAAYAISAFIVGFGIGIFIAGLNSGAPALWACVALIPVAIGLISLFGPK